MIPLTRLMRQFQVTGINTSKVHPTIGRHCVNFFQGFISRCSPHDALSLTYFATTPPWGPKMAFVLVAQAAEVYAAMREPEEKHGSTRAVSPHETHTPLK